MVNCGSPNCHTDTANAGGVSGTGPLTVAVWYGKAHKFPYKLRIRNNLANVKRLSTSWSMDFLMIEGRETLFKRAYLVVEKAI